MKNSSGKENTVASGNYFKEGLKTKLKKFHSKQNKKRNRKRKKKEGRSKKSLP